jgi:hypothetical protein
MKERLLLFLFFQISLFSLKAQNLVPNWSFEQYDTCPNASGQIYYATGWFNVALYPDYNNGCSSFPLYSVPTTFDGYTFYTDTTGKGDALIIPYFTYTYPPSVTGAPINERISFGCKLIKALQIGKKYYVSFTVRFILLNHPYDSSYGYNTASNNIGALFSTVSYVMPKDSEFDRQASYRYSLHSIRNYAQVYTNNIISDTTHWVVISGFFIADSAYTYLNIGNFFADSLTSYSLLFNDTAQSHIFESIYLVDDICVTSDSLNSCALEADIGDIPAQNHTINADPNPTTKLTLIYISGFSNSLTGHITIYDISARKVRDGNICFEDGKYILQKLNLPDGMYDVFIQINNLILNKKIIFIN